VARADLDRVLAQRSEATRGIDVAAGGAEQRRVAMVRATLLSPFDGLVTRRLREPGDTVTIGSTVLRIVDTSRVYVNAAMDETMLPQLAVDQRAVIAFPGAGPRSRGGSRGSRGRPTARPTSSSSRSRPSDWSAAWPSASAPTCASRSAPGERPPHPVRMIHHDDRALRVRRSRRQHHRGAPRFGLTGADHVEVLDGLAEGDAVLAAPRRPLTLPIRATLGGPMNLALRDVRRHFARFVGTAAGLGLLLSVVVAMQGIYAGWWTTPRS
jgi:HlyD family secretion protein